MCQAASFFTPLDPIEEITYPTVLPQRDAILDTLLNEPLIFPGTDEVSAGNYVLAIDDQGTIRGIGINGSLTETKLTSYERTIGESLIAEGNQLIAVDDFNVRKSLSIPKKLRLLII